MDMTGVELSVANTHRQVQRMEDEVLKPFMEGGYLAREDCRILEEVFRARIEDLELVKERTDTKCESVQEVLTSWMVTFEALETSVGSVATRIQDMEDHLVDRSKELRDFSELVLDQAATIRLLQERVGELELGHGVLQARMINIEVKTSMVA
jgi:chromosome segregation ATPase